MFAVIITTLTLSVCAVGVNAGTVLIQSPGVVRVREGGTVLIQCVLESSNVNNTVDKFDVHWYNSRNKLSAEGLVVTLYKSGHAHRSGDISDRFQLSRNVTTNTYSLTISNVRITDPKLYICGIWGKVFGNGTQLNVTNSTDDPVLVQYPPVSKVPEGVTVQLHCALYNVSVNVTDVHWYHQRPGNKSEWALSHFVNDSVSRSGCISDRFQSHRNVVSNSYILTISNTSISDTAVYNCSVWNYIYGGGTQLNVTGADVPVLIQSPSIQRVTEGHTAWLWCTISKARLEHTDVHWYRKLPGQDMEWVLTHRAGGSPEWGRGFTKRFQSYRDTSNSSFNLTVTDVVHSDSAVYYCRVWGDIDGNGTQLIVTDTTDDPVLVQFLPISKVPEGVTVQLHCALYNASVNVTDVHWYHQRPGNKNEWALSHFVNDSVSRSGCISDRFQSHRNVVSNSYILTISNTSISDTAVYNCSVWNYIYGGGTQLNVTGAGVSWKVLASILASVLVLVLLFYILLSAICYVKKWACFQQRLKPEGCSTEDQSAVYATIAAEPEMNIQVSTNITVAEQSEVLYADIQFLRQKTAPKIQVTEETTEYAVVKCAH